MPKLASLYAPLVATVTPGAGTLTPGQTVTIDTNLEATVLYTLDGSRPEVGAVGTKAAVAPAEIVMAVSATLKYQAFSNQRPTNMTKMRAISYTVPRTRPLEEFRDRKHFLRALLAAIVDHNFFSGDGWTAPKAIRPFTYLVKNIESIRVRVRVLHNGRETRTDGYPTLDPGQAAEFGMQIQATENMIEVQTQ